MIHAEPVRVLADNVCWLLTGAGGAALAVDPGDAAPVAHALEALGLTLGGVLLTHHHADHTAGAMELAAGRPVYGPASLPAVTHPVGEGDAVPFAGEVLTVRHTPGHTRDHLCYLAPGLAATGDTLFAAGCGRLFEGSAAEMHRSLTRLASLPPETLVLCGHDYTLDNLRFAAAVEPGNRAVTTRLELARRAAAGGRLAVPSTIAEELATNPFLRTAEPAVRAAAARHAGREPRSDADTFAILRSWKDGFRPAGPRGKAVREPEGV